MTEDEVLGAKPLADRLRIAAVDLAVTGAPRALFEAVWIAIEKLTSRKVQDTSALLVSSRGWIPQADTDG